MVILGEDILTVPTERIKDIEIEMTIIDGHVFYKNMAIN
jgi:predicted amidohydrolase YtcJ